MADTSSRRPRRRAKQPTIAEVAREAGVSAITVSRVLNTPESVRETTRRRVEAAIETVGYVPNRLAGSLASAQSRFIAVIVPSLSNIVFTEVIQGLQATFEARGYQILLGNTDYDLQREDQLVGTFLGWSPAALVITGLRHSEVCGRRLRQWEGPIVEIMELGTAIDLNVGLDHLKAGRCMAGHLRERGYRRVVYVGAQMARDYRARLRYEGHCEVLAAAGLEAPLLDMDQLGQFETGARALDQVLATHPETEAIHFANDDLATGALLHANRLGIAVPQRIAIAGFNGLAIGQHVTPRLTSIASPRELIGRRAAQAVLARLDGEATVDGPLDVGFTLMAGEST